ncbi:MAG: acetate--CoA ligase family protein [Burkholderiales bacterium]|nr:acetate--CoA ligase family protein [Burkholderiales bacterium]
MYFAARREDRAPLDAYQLVDAQLCPARGKGVPTHWVPRSHRPRPTTLDGELAIGAAASILAEFGVAYAHEVDVNDAESAAIAADGMGYPAVLKGVVPGCLHKTDHGLVTLGLTDRSKVIACVGDMRLLTERPTAFAVQRQSSGLELIVGIVRDAAFGPGVLLAWGGIFAEAMNRRVLAAPPFDHTYARAMIAAIDPKGVLDGYRTGQTYAIEGLAQLLVNVGEMALACPWLDWLDLNPVIVNSAESVAVDQVMVISTP